MKIYTKKVKRHDEVWADVYDYGEGRVKVCIGNSNYGRFYVSGGNWEEGEPWGVWMDEKKTEEAMTLFKKIWEERKDYKPFAF